MRYSRKLVQLDIPCWLLDIQSFNMHHPVSPGPEPTGNFKFCYYMLALFAILNRCQSCNRILGSNHAAP
jgi:hypothetical protein